MNTCDVYILPQKPIEPPFRQYIENFEDKSCHTCSYRQKCTLISELVQTTLIRDLDVVFACWFRDRNK